MTAVSHPFWHGRGTPPGCKLLARSTDWATPAASSWCPRSRIRAVASCSCCTSCCIELRLKCQGNPGPALADHALVTAWDRKAPLLSAGLSRDLWLFPARALKIQAPRNRRTRKDHKVSADEWKLIQQAVTENRAKESSAIKTAIESGGRDHVTVGAAHKAIRK